MQPISARTRTQGWLDAAYKLLKADSRIYNLILEIEEPGRTTPTDALIDRRVDDFLRSHDHHPLNTVAETIFPATEYRLRGIQGVYDYADTIYPLIKSESPWGTYALRLTRRGTLNPLEILIQKARHQLELRGTKYAVYELSAGPETQELALYIAETDHSKVIGGQCLSHISIKLGPRPDYAVYLTALYRYQYFGQKALGNLLGLARLQACIARELGVPLGPLVCHATLAVLEHKAVEALLDACREIERTEGAAA
jgi:hypothetical protein